MAFNELLKSDIEDLNNTIKCGSFSLYTFSIYLNTPSVKEISSLSDESKATLCHELGHMFHYFTTYFGLIDLRYWIVSLNVLSKIFDNTSPEKQSSTQSGLIFGLARERQMLSIDESYYYEKVEEYIEEARLNPKMWTVSPTIGRLFTFDGELSEKHFWAVRFFIGDPAEGRSFIRIPMGISTALEHIAKAIDWLHVAHQSNISAIESFRYAAGEPDLLKYYCLTHCISPRLEKEYGLNSIPRAFVISGILLALICEIPFDNQSIWEILRLYAKKHVKYIYQYMNFPHPSFLFPIFLEAAFSCGINLAKFDFTDMDDFINRILKELDLPTLEILHNDTKIIRKDIMKFLNNSDLMKNIASLLNWVFDNSDKLTWTQRIFSHAFVLPHLPPVPIIFNDGALEGNILSIDSVYKLIKAKNHYNEILRYPFTRNIVDERYPYLKTISALIRK